jgi:starch synthase (maltosyl-transferring)
MKELEGRKRVSIVNVTPQLDCGKYPIKRIVNEKVTVQADIFVDGHDKVKALLLYRKSKGQSKWKESPMVFLGNDHWEGSFSPDSVGNFEYTIEAWVDHFSTWQYGLKKKFEDNQDIKTELQIGVDYLEKAKANASAGEKKKLQVAIDLINTNSNEAKTVSYALSDTISELMATLNDKEKVGQYSRILPVKVEPQHALFSAWYEFFPRSTSSEEGKHGTFKDCERVLEEVAQMGFDVVYLPPIHPIGEKNRKGLNNATTANEGDPGSPWAIGSRLGGHKAIHPELGTIEDFESMVKKASDLNIKIALDFAIQCAPDHPYVTEHPDWFTWRPDGTVQYAENPPKKYQDVLPVNFETPDWENLWKELKSIVDYWISKGVRIFRVDNPHTKPFKFWEWMIREVHAKHPDIIFLAEAFTRPRIMEQLAKVGFNQSYTYYTWRNSREEIRQYMEELTKTDRREYFRPNFWPNTPDILPISLEEKGEPSFMIRLIMAATLTSNYGMYGPVFEYGLNKAYPGKEEYIDSEKYEIKVWDWQKQTRVKDLIGRVNQIRKENTALQSTWHIEFADIDNTQLIGYCKTDQDKTNKLLIVVNLDPNHTQAGWIKVPLAYLGLSPDQPYQVHDLLTGERYTWNNEWNYIQLNPHHMPAHIFRIE